MAEELTIYVKAKRNANSPSLMKATRTSSFPHSCGEPQVAHFQNGLRVFPSPRSSRMEHRKSATERERSTCDSCCQDRPERACYTPIPIRATSDTPRTVGWQCWTTAPQPSSRPDSRSPSAESCGSRSMRAMARRSLTACARKVSSSQTSTLNRIPPALPVAVHRAATCRRVPLHPGMDARTVHSHQRPRSGGDFGVGLKLNIPPSYLLIHRVRLGSIGAVPTGCARRITSRNHRLGSRLRPAVAPTHHDAHRVRHRWWRESRAELTHTHRRYQSLCRPHNLVESLGQLLGQFGALTLESNRTSASR